MGLSLHVFWSIRRDYLLRRCKWQYLAGGWTVRLHLLPSLVLPAQRSFLFLAAFFFALGIKYLHDSWG
jgi:hypothetical protein